MSYSRVGSLSVPQSRTSFPPGPLAVEISLLFEANNCAIQSHIRSATSQQSATYKFPASITRRSLFLGRKEHFSRQKLLFFRRKELFPIRKEHFVSAKKHFRYRKKHFSTRKECSALRKSHFTREKSLSSLRKLRESTAKSRATTRKSQLTPRKFALFPTGSFRLRSPDLVTTAPLFRTIAPAKAGSISKILGRQLKNRDSAEWAEKQTDGQYFAHRRKMK